MSDIYLKDKNQNTASEDELREMIMVVPSPLKIVLAVVAAALAVTILWVLFGWGGTVISMTGIYHPGVSEEGEILCFPNVVDGKQIEEGMTVSVYIDGYDNSMYGHFTGCVTYVDSYVTSSETIYDYVGEESVAGVFGSNAPCVCVICKLDEDPSTVSGYACSNSNGRELQLRDGSFVSVSILISGEQTSLGDIYKG